MNSIAQGFWYNSYISKIQPFLCHTTLCWVTFFLRKTTVDIRVSLMTYLNMYASTDQTVSIKNVQMNFEGERKRNRVHGNGCFQMNDLSSFFEVFQPHKKIHTNTQRINSKPRFLFTNTSYIFVFAWNIARHYVLLWHFHKKERKSLMPCAFIKHAKWISLAWTVDSDVVQIENPAAQLFLMLRSHNVNTGPRKSNRM